MTETAEEPSSSSMEAILVHPVKDVPDNQLQAFRAQNRTYFIASSGARFAIKMTNTSSGAAKRVFNRSFLLYSAARLGLDIFVDGRKVSAKYCPMFVISPGQARVFHGSVLPDACAS